MPNTADEIIDRRRLRRKLTFWRVVALAIAAIAIIASGFGLFADSLGPKATDHIAKVRIEGTITDDEELLKRLRAVAESQTVKGVILAVDSPGGTTAGGEAIYEAVRKISAQKPVVAQVGTLAASAGYMISSASDHIVARQSSIVGSIGVLFQFPDVTGLMDKIGVKLEGVKSSPLKAEPSPFSPTTDEEREMIRAMIMDSYDWFVGLVEERRPLSRAEVLALADGSVFTGRQALENKLVDSLGGEDEARAWLEGKGLAKNLKVIEWKADTGAQAWLTAGSATAAIARLLGLPVGGDLLSEVGADRIFLDGLVSVWHPETAR
ncbi:signal peptide peptidase SppA [Mesorhizobium sp. Z1-4]|uniref:signal peptide peptidase SppA n=1 Tax=Mesorhizobium sp. Z1-4 TaxID=2448478 RepID=UPI000FDAA25E|nr:signal peptide peptidase SppA [Mesorhizobium sp. Z1-4]